MAGERDRILKIKKFLNTLGIDVNIGRTKARGNKGIFIGRQNSFRIDISKDLPEEKILPVIIHEFVHYVHYLHDKKLKSLNFVFEEITEAEEEELINITVREIPKDFASSLYLQKEKLRAEIKTISGFIKSEYPDFKSSKGDKALEKNLGLPFRYLLKYDRIKIFNKIYSVGDVYENISEVQRNYLLLKSKQRALARINSKINRLNKYYNTPSELFARFCELYFLNKEKSYELAPNLSSEFCRVIESGKIQEFSDLDKLISKI